MRIVARIKNTSETKKLINLGVDVFLVDTPLAVRKVSLEPFNNLNILKNTDKQIYFLMNKMIHEEDLSDLRDLLEIAKKEEVDGIVCGDMSVLVMAKEFNLESKVIYQPGTMNTNSFDSEFFSRENIKGLTISKEITLEEIKKIFKNKFTELSLIGHGFIDMFYSKRMLLSNYYIYKEFKLNNIKNNDGYRLKEEMRPDSYYPIFEDESGTHVFRDKALESFAEFNELKTGLDDFFIERIFLEDEEYFDSIKAYKNPEFIPVFLSKYQSHYNKGFYYQYTEKIKGELDEN